MSDPVHKLKVVRIIARLNGGGPARQVCYLHSALKRSCDTALIVGSLADGEHDMGYLLDSEQRVFRVGAMSRSVSIWRDLVSFFRVVRILRHERPDIVHTHTAKAGALGRVAALLAFVPVRIHTYHGNVFSGYFSPAMTRLVISVEKLLNRITTSVIAISPSQADELTNLYCVAKPEQVEVVRTGFDLQSFKDDSLREESRRQLGVKPDQTLVVWAGRLVPIKNLELLLDVARRCAGMDHLRFVVAGDGPEKERLAQAAHSLPNLSAVGWRTDMRAIWAAADIALVTSRNEGTPTALIEAMAMGRPFVATAVGGVVDLAVPLLQNVARGCQQARNGFLVSADTECVVSALTRLSADRELAKRMGAAGREFVLKHHPQERLLDQIEALYFRLARPLPWSERALPGSINAALSTSSEFHAQAEGD